MFTAFFLATFDARLRRIGERGERSEEEAPEAETDERGEDAVPTDAPLGFEAWAAIVTIRVVEREERRGRNRQKELSLTGKRS